MSTPSEEATRPLVHVCPHCGGDDVSYDWEVVLSIRCLKDVVQYVVLGSGAGVLPTQMFCNNCNLESGEFDLPTDQFASAVDLIPEDLCDEKLLYELPSSSPR